MLLAKYFLKKFEAPLNKKFNRFTNDALAVIAHYQWPGNVRELENKLKRAMVLAEGTVITSTDLGLDAASATENFLTLKQIREKTERGAIMQALELSRNNVSAASKLLGVSRPTLYDLMKTLNLRT